MELSDKNWDKNWISKTIIFLASQTISLFGSSIVGFAIIWYITLETSSGIYMTISIVTSFLPQILISFFAGVWADRYNRKLLIIFADLFIAVSTLILVFFFVSGEKSIWLIFLVSAIRSIGSGVQAPAVSAILPQLVPAEKLTRVNGMNSSINSVMYLIAPAVGGILLNTFDFAYTLLFDVFTAIFAAFILSFLKIGTYKTLEETGSILDDFKKGIAYSKSNILIKNLLLFYSIFFFLITPAAFLSPLMVERSFGGEIWKLTANEMVWTLGSLVGGVVVSIWGGFKNKIYTLGISSLGFGITFALLGVSTNFILYLTIMFISGIFMPFFATAETVLVQENVEENMLGRIFAIVQIIASITMPVGMLIFGPLSDVIKIEYILIGCGVLLSLLSVYIISNKELKKLDKGSFNEERKIL